MNHGRDSAFPTELDMICCPLVKNAIERGYIDIMFSILKETVSKNIFLSNALQEPINAVGMLQLLIDPGITLLHTIPLVHVALDGL